MKNKIRLFAKEHRKKLNTKLLSSKIKENLFNLDEYKNSKNICTYYSFGNEVETESFFYDLTKNWFIPKTCENDLLICPYDKNKLSVDKYGILEPTTPNIDSFSKLDMIIIPALAADKNGYRIGYGKGYYDRFLNKLTHNPCKVILLYSDLLFDNVYPECHDIKCDYIITEKEILKINC